MYYSKGLTGGRGVPGESRAARGESDTADANNTTTQQLFLPSQPPLQRAQGFNKSFAPLTLIISVYLPSYLKFYIKFLSEVFFQTCDYGSKRRVEIPTRTSSSNITRTCVQL